MKTLFKLQSMIDKTYWYRNEKAVIRSFDNSTGEFELIIEIDGQPKKFLKTTEQKLELFLANFHEVEQIHEEPEPVHNAMPMLPENESAKLYTENKQVFTNLSQVLMEDIERVREKPEYVGQAKQVSNSVNALVNLTKLQLQLIKNR